MSWVPILVGSAAGTTVLGVVGRWFLFGWRAARTLIGTIHTVKELALLMHRHTELHHKKDAEDRQAIADIVLRLERLENEVRDIVSLWPHLRRNNSPEVPSQVKP